MYDALTGLLVGFLAGMFLFMVLGTSMRDKAKRYDVVVAACEEHQPRHIQCEIFAAPVQKVFAPATQTNAAPQQGDRS